MADLTAPKYSNETAARRHLELVRWPDGPVCPHCGSIDRASSIKGGRDGLYFCNECRKQFTVTVGTVFERSKIPLHKWLLANHLVCCSKKGMSAHQLHRMLGVTYKTAWFMTHRIREAMRETNPGPLGGGNKVVEVDETYIGGKETNKHKSKRRRGQHGGKGKEPVLALVERDGKVRSEHLSNVSAKTLRNAIVTQVDRASHLITDDALKFGKIGEEFAGHGTVNHSAEECARANFWHTNTVEGYFSVLKRGITGVYHHVSPTHLHRYLAEFDYRYNERKISDVERADKSLKGIQGKRLTYRQVD